MTVNNEGHPVGRLSARKTKDGRLERNPIYKDRERILSSVTTLCKTRRQGRTATPVGIENNALGNSSGTASRLDSPELSP